MLLIHRQNLPRSRAG